MSSATEKVKRQGTTGGNGEVLTVAALAKHKRLPVVWLRKEIGLADSSGGVTIPYRDYDGKELFRKTRKTLDKNSYRNPKGRPMVAYGSDRLDEARQAQTMVLVEGETDCWTLWFHGRPALGIPGADHTGKLQAQHVADVSMIYVIDERDQGAQTFIPGVVARLQELSWSGSLFRVVMPEGCKDPSDLHVKYADDPDGFKAALQTAIDNSKPIPLARPHDRSGHATVEPVVEREVKPPVWPDPPDEAAYYGLAGDFVRLTEPVTEADPVAMLGQFLVGFGNLIGHRARFIAEDDSHFLNLFLVLIGKTSKGRKGTSWGRARKPLAAVDPVWATECINSGLSTGEGLIQLVCDPVVKKNKNDKEVFEDKGVTDKRLLCFEPEFASVLKRTDQQGNTLTAVLRMAFDSGDLRTLTRHSPQCATGAHVSLIGHSTTEELTRYLSATEQANGFGNRVLWICCRRSKVLPEGGSLDPAAMEPINRRLAQAVSVGHATDIMVRDGQAREIWYRVYEQLSEGRPGMVGALLGRAEVYVMRLACLYALLDESSVIQSQHMRAALALWSYAERSVEFVFGSSLGDPVADEVLRLLRAAGKAGITRTEIRDFFGRNRSTDRICRALGLLQEHKLARSTSTQEKGSGRPVERWFAMGSG